MRILIINHEFPQLGTEAGESCYFFLREYSKNPNLEIDYVTVSVDGQYHQLQMGEKIAIHRLPLTGKLRVDKTLTKKQLLRFAWESYNHSLKLSKTVQYDLSHAFFSFPAGLTSSMLKWKLKLPYCVSLQELDLSENKNALIEYGKTRAWKNASFLIAGEAKLAEIFQKVPVKKEINLICSKGIDTTSFFPDDSRRAAEYFTIVCDGELVPIKGVRYIIQAFKLLSNRFGQVRLFIVGDGKERQSLEDLARGLEVSDRIVFLGNITPEECLQHYQAADVFVQAALDNSADNADITRRALAVGLPIIATNADEIQELVIDQANGFLIKINTADDLAEKIEKFILDNNLKTSMSAKSLEISQNISWQAIAKQYVAIYEKTRNLGRITQD